MQVLQDWFDQYCDKEEYEGYDVKEVLEAIGVMVGALPGLLSHPKSPVVPKEIGLLDIPYVELQGTGITEIPAELCDNPEMVYMELHDNYITELPSAIGNLVSLRWLYLRNNSLTILPYEVGNLENLEHLSIEDNPLTTLPFSLINLKKVTVCINQALTLPIQMKSWAIEHIHEVEKQTITWVTLGNKVKAIR